MREQVNCLSFINRSLWRERAAVKHKLFNLKRLGFEALMSGDVSLNRVFGDRFLESCECDVGSEWTVLAWDSNLLKPRLNQFLQIDELLWRVHPRP